MLHFGCDALAEDVFGYSPLAHAAERGHVGVIPILVSFGVSVDCKNHAGETPLMLACKNGHVGAVTMLLRLGADSRKVTPMGKSVEAYANNNSAVLAALGFGESIREAATSETVGAALV
jgi:ankyrin repeat protein